MADSCLVLFCGLPGAGKSTFAAKLFETLSDHSCIVEVHFAEGNTQIGTKGDGQMYNGVIEMLTDCHVIHMCFDDILPDNLYKNNGPTMGYSSSDEKLWKTYRSYITEFVEEFLKGHSSKSGVFLESEKSRISKELEYIYSKIEKKNFCRCYESAWINHSCGCGSKHIILLDDNMFYSSMRYKYFQMARKYMTGFLQIYISCSKANLLKQNSERAAAVSLETIEHMASVFEPPDQQKNGWESNSVEFNSTNDDMNSILYKVLSMIGYSMQNPVPSLEIEDTLAKNEARKINLQSILHQADQVLRKCISSKMKEYQGLQMPKQYFKIQSSVLNSRRKSFLDVLRRSSKTLMHLDSLLLDCCNGKSSKVSSKDSDVPFFYNEACTIPASELKSGSQYFCSKSRFETVVSHLFGSFNTEQISLDGIYVVNADAGNHGNIGTSQEE